MKLFIFLLVTLNFVSCSVKSDGKDKEEQVQAQRSINTELDSDGDMITDIEEGKQGLDRFVANVPKIKTNFLQDYSIQVTFDDDSSFSIDTRVARDNPDFKYRVGDLYLKEHSFDNAAKLGRFSGVSWGRIKQEDFSWIKYPEIDKEFYFSKTQEFERILKNRKIKKIKIDLDNTLKLLESNRFQSINQLELNFYYYSYSKESFVQLHTEKIDKIFHSGVREDFQVIIDQPPRELLQDTYFRHGQFIISEVKDFYIPDLKMKYSELIKSVKNKTIPVYKSTPFENSLDYVAILKDGESFINIMTKLFSDKFIIQSNKLFQVEQFSNNLPDFKYLYELDSSDKNGNWFVMTNKIKKHYLKHQFTKIDSISISYVTGKDLSRRVSERVYSFSESIYSGDTSKKYVIGNVDKNSEINFSVFPKLLKGIKLVSTPGRFNYRPPNCRNCTGTNWSVSAEFVTNSFTSFQREWGTSNLEELNDSIKVLINNNVIDLTDLINRNLATVELRELDGVQYIYYSISKLSELDIIKSGSENIVSVKVSPLSLGEAGEGLQINSMGGHNIDKFHHAGQICLQEAFKRKVKLAVTSWKFSEWEKKVPWGKPDPRTGWKPVKGQKHKYWDGIVVDLISTVTNNFN
jgi:hypothetical protein